MKQNYLRICASFSQELLALLRAGLSIVECLEALSEKETHVATNQTLAQLLQNLHEGKRFSVALKEQTHVFSFFTLA
jgi:general secretion pathway protein F